MYEYFGDENHTFGQTICLLHSFLQNKNTKRLISPEREFFGGSNFARFILEIYICFIGNVNWHLKFDQNR